MENLLKDLQPIISTTFISIIGYGLILLRSWIKHKILMDKNNHALITIDNIIQAVVNDIEQTIRPNLNTKLSYTDAKYLKNIAKSRTLKLLNNELLKYLNNHLDDIDSYVYYKIEEKLRQEKVKNNFISFSKLNKEGK